MSWFSRRFCDVWLYFAQEHFDLIQKGGKESFFLQAGDSAPSQQQYEVFKMLRGQLDQQLAAWKQIMSSDVAAFNQLIKNSNVPALYLPPAGE